MRLSLNNLKAATIMDTCNFLNAYEANEMLIYETINKILDCRNKKELEALHKTYMSDDSMINKILLTNNIVESDIDEWKTINDAK
jgi:hypothetical protein